MTVSASSVEEALAAYDKNKNLSDFNLEDVNFAKVGRDLVGVNLDRADIYRGQFQGLDLTKASLCEAHARRVNFTRSKLISADLRGADLRGSDMSYADLTNADLRGCSIKGLLFTNASVKGMRIDRHALRSLGPENGGLTDADLIDLKIDDDSVRLMVGFSGLFAVTHVVSVLIFLLPYLVYGYRLYISSVGDICSAAEVLCIPLRSAMWEYVQTGGGRHDVDCFGLLIFFLLIIYSVFRISLAIKAQRLSVTERASGIPQRFVLKGYWRYSFYGCQLLAPINLIMVLVRTYELMGLNVPVA